MSHVLITLSGGIIDRVRFYDEPSYAVLELIRFVRKMNPEKDDAAVYGPEGLIANAKILVHEESQVSDSDHEEKDALPLKKPVYVMADSQHRLGFLVVGPCEQKCYTNPLAALSALERMRKELRTHINLYRFALVRWAIAGREEMEKYNADHSVKDFEYCLVSEFLR